MLNEERKTMKRFIENRTNLESLKFVLRKFLYLDLAFDFAPLHVYTFQVRHCPCEQKDFEHSTIYKRLRCFVDHV